MFAEKPKKDKQLLAENIWLNYFNDVLYRNGIITQSHYRKMIHKIDNRTKVLDNSLTPSHEKNKQ